MDCQEQTSQPKPKTRPQGHWDRSPGQVRKLRTSSVRKFRLYLKMGLSENSVPLHPMVNDHYLY